MCKITNLHSNYECPQTICPYNLIMLGEYPLVSTSTKIDANSPCIIQISINMLQHFLQYASLSSSSDI